ncbi:bifunctional hydroxymethylpyrimidine kinase/phosphomethylpyrimidine kinase, partial [Paramuribaculum intestinale]
MRRYIPVLTIAGSDSSGGAGIQADIKTMSAIGCYGMSAITALTAQNTVGVEAIEGVSPMMVKAQIDAVFADISPAAVKTGMLFSTPIVEAVAEALGRHCVSNLVVDPVMVSTTGKRLIAD